MFERYTERARRVIFFGRYEASQFGSSFIEAEHLLLGILREDKALTSRFLRSHSTVVSIRKQIEQNTTLREKVSTSVDLPLSDEAKRVLAFAAEEADRMGTKQIGTEHLFLGLLRETGSLPAKILQERGIHLDTAREQIAKVLETKAAESVAEVVSTGGMFRNLTQAATDGPSHEALVVRAIELLDAAGAMVKLRRDPMPPEVKEARKRIAFIVQRRESGLANHEFEKARFYEGEERKEREGLQALESRLGIDGTELEAVTPEDIEKVLAQWSEYPYSE